MRTNYKERYSPGFYPTHEDLLDIHFGSIVSDLRSIVRGTLVPRTWTDISGTWVDKEKEVTNRALHRNSLPGVKETPEVKKLRGEGVTKYEAYCKKMRDEARAERERKVRKLNPEERRMMYIFLANGLSEHDARTRAIELMKEIQ